MVASNSASSSNNKGISERRVASNRANAAKSTGPRTEEGKAASRLNAVIHGLCTTLMILPGEQVEQFNAFASLIRDELKPTGQAEAVIVDQYVSTAWKLKRLAAAEGKAFARAAGTRIGETDGADVLESQLYRGEGSMLRLMALEDRLGRVLGRTIRTLKDMRMLKRVIREDETAARPEETLEPTVDECPPPDPVGPEVQTREVDAASTVATEEVPVKPETAVENDVRECPEMSANVRFEENVRNEPNSASVASAANPRNEPNDAPKVEQGRRHY